MTKEQVTNGVDIAIKAMQYAFWYSDRRAGEIKDALRIIFGDDIIEAALRQLTGKSPSCVNPLDADEIAKQTTDRAL